MAWQEIAETRQSSSTRVAGHDLVGEKLDGTHGLFVAQVAPLEGAGRVARELYRSKCDGQSWPEAEVRI